ncbi:YjgP/YjgQ family permease [Deinococcus psychrotolerans]|uniref:YjgP/YjgQ family permease n=1 Tax=Deinococcus psychrotolerans TaxID=2489213 RepID=A0A3G8YBX2_9DEIO|nr:LptF/LptG family permease [Deinococcus psychrotolerans]AZI42433.1 YjgP/YjgQ family permease [Deinococcus psychrotolerans]
MRLTRYVTRELLPPLIAGTLMFTAVLSFGYFFISSQFIVGAPIALIVRWIAYQVPDTLVKIFPMAVVLMVVVAFGRMATERELVAVQSGGISLGRLARPAAILALLVTALSVWLSLWAAPAANVATRSLYWDVLTSAGLSTLSGKTVDLGKGLLLSLTSYDTKTQLMNGVRIEQWGADASKPQQATIIFAESGTFTGNEIKLNKYQLYTANYAGVQALSQIPDTDPAAFREAVQTIFPLGVTAPSDPNAPLIIDTGLSRAETLAKYADAIGADSAGWPQLITQLTAPNVPQTERDAARLTLNRKLSLPFGNLVLALVALPFALRFGRSLGVALGSALLISVVYYLLFFVGLTVAGQSAALSEVGAWLANIIFFFTGLWLLRRA